MSSSKCQLSRCIQCAIFQAYLMNGQADFNCECHEMFQESVEIESEGQDVEIS